MNQLMRYDSTIVIRPLAKIRKNKEKMSYESTSPNVRKNREKDARRAFTWRTTCQMQQKGIKSTRKTLAPLLKVINELE